MKVLQSLGVHRRNSNEGIFRYQRGLWGLSKNTKTIVRIQPAHKQFAELRIDDVAWCKLLREIRRQKPATQPLAYYKKIIRGMFRKRSALGLAGHITFHGGTATWTSSHESYVVAILEHEGSIDLPGTSRNPIQLASVLW